MSIDSRWYVIHTYSGYENKVAVNIEKVVENRGLQDQILDIKIPTEIVEEVGKDEKRREVERKLFPGYVLVNITVSFDKDHRPTITDDTWLAIRNIRGVTGFVGPQGKPMPLSDKEVLALGVEKRSIEVKYEVGDTVTIVDEIFDGFTGTVEEIDIDNDIVKVTVLALFGKETLVELGLDQVEPIKE